MKAKKLFLAVGLFLVSAFSQNLFAQGLNWEGQTGALITPFAYTAASPAGKFGKPEVAFHYLNTGSVIGNDYKFSITEGIARRKVNQEECNRCDEDNDYCYLCESAEEIASHPVIVQIPRCRGRFAPRVAPTSRRAPPTMSQDEAQVFGSGG